MGTNQQEGHSKAKVTASASSPVTLNGLPICANFSPSCNCNRRWATADGCAFRKAKCKRTMRMTRNAMHYARILTLGCENGWGKFLHEVSAEQTTSVLNLPLVKGLKRNKGINCCIDFCKLQAFDAWVGELTEHNPTFIHTTNQHRFSHRNFAEEETKQP